MRVTKIAEFGESARVPEYVVGAAQREITYPGLSQCISITGYHVGRVLGTHISPGCTAEEVKEHFRLLSTSCGNHYPTWYIAGQFTKHFATPKAVMGSMDKFRKTVRKELGSDATYHVFDTSSLTETEGWSFGIDIRAELQNDGLKFGFAKFGGRRDKAFHNLALWYFKRM